MVQGFFRSWTKLGVPQSCPKPATLSFHDWGPASVYFVLFMFGGNLQNLIGVLPVHPCGRQALHEREPQVKSKGGIFPQISRGEHKSHLRGAKNEDKAECKRRCQKEIQWQAPDAVVTVGWNSWFTSGPQE